MSRSEPLKLSSKQVHLWTCKPSEISDPDLLHKYHALMNNKERHRYHRFHFEKDRHRHLVTRALIKTSLSQYQPHIPPQAWQFNHNDFGKPSISTPIPQSIEFNISHSKEFIVIAIAQGSAIGVDIECITQRNNIEGLIDRCFNTDEKTYILANDQAYLQERFFQLWTLKESYIKAYGKGLSINLKDIHFKIHDDKVTIGFSGKHTDTPKHWAFHSVQPHADYQLAITLRQCASLATSIKVIESVPLAQQVDGQTLSFGA